MQVRSCLAALLLVCLTALPLRGQAPPPSLQEADRAFADALVRHDREAFIALFAPDAESSLPVLKKGPEAIATSWLPFLIDPGTTMALTNTAATVGPAGDTGTTTGAFDIRGQTKTNNGVRTIPGGNYSIAWRLIDGQWKISSLSGSPREKSKASDRGGVGRFRFGMTRAEVSSVPDCQPYTNVPVTGGLECPRYIFEGHEMSISFLFAGDALRRIQLWFYEGTSDAEAREAVARVLEYLQRMGGGVTSTALPAGEVTPERVMELLNRTPLQPGRITQLEICTRDSRNEVWFSRIGRHEHGYGVMLFADAAGSR